MIRISEGRKEANCKLCLDSYRYSGSTTILWRHMSKKHGDIHLEAGQLKAELRERIKESQQDPTHVWVKESPTKSPKKIKIDDQPKINKIFKPKTSIEYDVSKLVAHDGLTFNQVASSSFIQAHLECTHKKT